MKIPEKYGACDACRGSYAYIYLLQVSDAIVMDWMSFGYRREAGSGPGRTAWAF
jgi:hypothetical protein